MFNPTRFVGVLNKTFHGRDGLRRFRRLWNAKAGTATRLVKNLMASLAASSGCRQVPELWRIDLLWFRGGESHRYAAGSKFRRYPISLPECAIEWENWSDGNPGAALIRLIGVRARQHVLLAWGYVDPDTAGNLEGVHSQLRKCGRLYTPVLVVLLNGDKSGPLFRHALFRPNASPKWRTSAARMDEYA